MSQHKSDIEIAQASHMKHITEIATGIGLEQDDLLLYGEHKAKIKMASINRILSQDKQGKLILVTAVTPTSAGEGKTTTSVGLAQGLQKIGKKAMVALREPSLGPVFGVKGGAAGGGYSQLLPMEEINLHFTGDLHAITAAHNLISASLDNHLHFKNKKNISVRHILWKRVIDMNDRSLRYVNAGLGGEANGVPRETGFDITAASEIMAILCLSSSYSELKEKVGNIIVALTDSKEPIYVRDLNIQGAVAALLKDALLPNLVQTTENGAAFIHGGPFANIAQGANTILATKLALKLSDYAITEAGFGADLGAEKFFNIVSPYGGFYPSAVVLVVTVRALKLHGGVKKSELSHENVKAVCLGGENLKKHIENIRKFAVEPVVCINKFVADTDEEINTVIDICKSFNTTYALSEHWEHGGEGARDLAEKVAAVVDSSTVDKCNTLYTWEDSIENKINTIAMEIYGADGVDFSAEAKRDLKIIKKFGYEKLPICMAKTQNSLSDNPKKIGRPTGFRITVRGIVISSGAGFLVPLTGEIMRMPGLPKVPSAELIDINDRGEISGLF